MKNFLLFFVLLTLCGRSYAQESGSIENIEVFQRTGEEERVVDISFDLAGAGEFYDVYLEVSFDNGVSFTQINPGEVTGANDLAPANNIGIVWDGRKSYPALDASETIIRLTATRQLKDIDDNYYRTVKIGNQLWMAENLRVTKYNNDVPILKDFTTIDGAYAIYPHENIAGLSSDGEVLEAYGALYNWYAVNDTKGLCPTGWYVPSDDDWMQLVDYVVAQGFPKLETYDPNGVGNALKSCRQVDHPDVGDCNTSEHPRWNSTDTHYGIYGIDEFGFSALPGGLRRTSGSFDHIGRSGIWWTATESGFNAWIYFIQNHSSSFGRSYNYDKDNGFSVRCVRTDTGDGTPEVRTGVITNIEHTSATGSGEVISDSGAEVMARGLVYNTKPDPTTDDDFVSTGSGLGAFETELSGLVSNTLYYIRAFATNSAGTAYGDQISFRTQNEITSSDGTFTDPRDGQNYKWVTIGNQVWMAENLRYLPEVVDPGTGSNTIPYYYVYGYNGIDLHAAIATDNYQNYGVLYNWPAVMAGSSSSNLNPSGVQGVCPPGWHVPSDAEWTELVKYVVSQGYPYQWDDPYSADKALRSCRQVDHPDGGDCDTSQHPRWDSHTTQYGIDEFGFSALPGGLRRNSYGDFIDIGRNGYWWTATEVSYSTNIWRWSITHRSWSNKSTGISLRCVRDID